MADYPSYPAINQKDQEELNLWLSDLASEARHSRREVESQWESNLNYAKGKQWPEKIPEHRVDFVLNLIKSTIKRKAGLLTDTKPVIEVLPRSDESLTGAGEILTSTIRGIWDERSIMSELTTLLYLAQIFGVGPANVLWDRYLDFGRGDIRVKNWDPRHFLMDPGVIQAHNLQDAEYIIFEDLWPVAKLKYLFGKAARDLSSDTKYSYYSTYSQKDSPSALSAVTDSHGQPYRMASENIRSSAVPRVVLQEFWTRDWRTMDDLPKEVATNINNYLALMREQSPMEQDRYREKKPNDFVFNGGIRHAMRAGGKILLDEGNPYVDMQIPGEMMPWGMEVEHPWGDSEVHDLKKVQSVINKLGGTITENAIKVSNGIWIGDFTALTEKQWRMLDDRPNLKVQKRPGSDLRREPAPPMPGSTFATMTFLIQAIEHITGLGEQGKMTPRSGTSGVAVEALMMASQTVIRLQARELEGFLERVGQKMVSRVMQFYSSNRMLNIFGPDNRLIRFEFNRDNLIGALKGRRQEEVWSELKFTVRPGSSLAMSSVQDALLNANLYNMGLVPGKEVLKAVGKSNPEELISQARQERMMGMAPPAVPIRQGQGNGAPASYPAAPMGGGPPG